MLDVKDREVDLSPDAEIRTVGTPATPKVATAAAVRDVGERWSRRPWLSGTVRGLAFFSPIAAAVAASVLVASRLPAAAGVGELLLQWALLLTVGAGVARATRIATKKLLPLSALFELSLIFPDAAPSRLATAMSRPSDEELAQIVERTRRQGLPTDATEAAQTVLTLVTALSEHDRLTRGHSERVRVFATMIAEEMGLPATEISAIQWAGLLHDVGKLGVDEAILNKPGRLTEEEYEQVQTHTLTGAVMVEPLRPWLGDAVDAAVQHHERWDGGGYPYGLAGEEISLAARIVAVADVYDVITAKRSYKDPLPAAWARREIADGAGTQFDPTVVRAFLAISLNQMKLASGPFAWMAQVPILASLPIATMAAPMAAMPAANVATAAVLVAAASNMTPMDMPRMEPKPQVLEVTQPSAPLPASATTETSANAKPPVELRPATPAAADIAEAKAERAAPGPATAAPTPQTASPSTTPSGGSDVDDTVNSDSSAALAVRAAHDREVLEAEQKAADDIADVRAEHATKIAKIERDLAADVAHLDAHHADDLADIAELKAKTAIDVTTIEQELRSELAKLDEQLAEDLAKADADLAEDRAKADDAAEADAARADHAEKVAKLRAAYAEDVAKERADAAEDIAAKQEKLATERAKTMAEYDEAHAKLLREAVEDRAKADADLAEETASIREKRDGTIADLDDDLADALAELG